MHDHQCVKIPIPTAIVDAAAERGQCIAEAYEREHITTSQYQAAMERLRSDTYAAVAEWFNLMDALNAFD